MNILGLLMAFQGVILLFSYFAYGRTLGLLLGGLAYFFGGFLGFHFKIWWPIILAFIVLIFLRWNGFDPRNRLFGF